MVLRVMDVAGPVRDKKSWAVRQFTQTKLSRVLEATEFRLPHSATYELIRRRFRGNN